jgi:PAS domain S-box-containing protein
MAILNLADGAAVTVNDRLLAMTGYDPSDLARGRWSWAAVTPAEFLATQRDAMARVSEGRGPERYETEIARADATRVPVGVSVSLLPGSPGHVVVLVEDVSMHREAEARRALMVSEIEHRAKNMLAVIQSSLRLSAKTTHDSRALAAAVDGRIAALGRVQSLLTTSGWLDADLETLIRSGLAIFHDIDESLQSSHRVEGPPVRLAASAVQSLSMVIHELATNATKYGALSTPRGRLTVRWAIAAEAPALRLTWIEEGGPALAQPPAHRGFGTMLIDMMVQHLGGTVDRHWGPTGLVCEISADIPFSSERAPAVRQNAPQEFSGAE